MTEPLWTPSAERLERARLGPLHGRRARHVGASMPPTTGRCTPGRSPSPRSSGARCGISPASSATGQGERIVIDGDMMPGARWFPDARLNYAENLLRRRDEADALVFWGEGLGQADVSASPHCTTRCRAWPRPWRLVESARATGSRGYLPNMPETIISALAAASLGAVWSSCSSDFGTRGVLDRFGQIAPKVLIAADGFYFFFYGGKTFDRRPQVREILAELPTVEHVIVVPYAEESPASRRHQGRHPLRRCACRAAGRADRLRARALRPPAGDHVLLRHHRRAPSASSTAPAAPCCST